MKRYWFAAFAVIAVAGFCYTQYLIFYGTPLDRLLMFNQKIFYYHVPCWFMLFLSVFTCGYGSWRYLKKRDGRYDDIAIAAGELAVLFGAAGLITGSIWGKAAWNVWWTWDARLTMSLLLWLTMVGYVLVRKYGGPGSERLAAGLAIFACVSVPFVYFSVRIWRTLHPEASVVPGLEAEMRITFWLSVLLFTMFWTMLLTLRIGAARAQRSLNEARERGLDAGLFE
jgi:heme exporter protein C